MVVLADANAPLAEATTEYYGMLGAEHMNAAGVAVQNFCHSTQLLVPSTFSKWHTGRCTTWKHPKGNWFRRDYVMCSSALRDMVCASWVVENLDCGWAHEDHLPVCLRIEGQLGPVPKKRLRLDPCKLVDVSLQKEFALAVDQLDLEPWSTDIDSHALKLTEALQGLASTVFGRQKGGKKRYWMSDEAWNLVRWKKELWRWLRCLPQSEIHSLWVEQVRLEVKQVHAQVRLLLRRDRNAFLAEAVSSMESAGRMGDSKALFSLIREVLAPGLSKKQGMKPVPKLLDKTGEPCASYESRQACFMQHFAEQEAGEVVTRQELARRVQGSAAPNMTGWDHRLLPSVSGIMRKIAKLKPGKAPGPDGIEVAALKAGGRALAWKLLPLMTKAVVLRREPLAWKGGLLVSLFKGKGSTQEVGTHRAILVSDHMAKLHHSAIRDVLVEAWEGHAVDTQLGGRRKCGVDMAHHMVQAVTGLGARLGKPVALLFTDLKAAFYTIIRQSLMSVELSDQGLCHVLARMGVSPQEVHQLRQVAARDDAIGAGKGHLEHLVADMLDGSHFGMRGCHDLVHTHRGTRPGDPVGDVLFNMAMTTALKEIRRVAAEAGVRMAETCSLAQVLAAPMGQPVEPGCVDVAFFDDLALMLLGESCAKLVEDLVMLGVVVDNVMAERGLQVNYSAGKTEALLQLRGRNSKLLRDRIMIQQQAQLALDTTRGRQHLRIAHVYKHLGTWIQEAGRPDRERRARGAAAAKAFGPLRNAFYRSRHTDKAIKRRVFEATVVSKHSYNVHVWSWCDQQDLDKWQSDLTRWQVEMCKEHFEHVHAFEVRPEEVAGVLGSLTPQCKLSLARLRYAKRALDNAPPVLWLLLKATYGHPKSWLSHLEQDCAWLRVHLKPHEVPADTSVQGWLEFIQRAPHWKHLLTKAERACTRHLVNTQRMIVWEQKFMKIAQAQELSLPAPRPPPQPVGDLFWCAECETAWKTRRALAMHCTKKHGYKSSCRSWASGNWCHACGKLYHQRIRLMRHLHGKQKCLEHIQACFPPLPPGASQVLDDETLQEAQQYRTAGWAPHRALLPATRTAFVHLPPKGSPEAATMKAAWTSRWQKQGHQWHDMPYDHMHGRVAPCEESQAPTDPGPDHQVTPIVMQSPQGTHKGPMGHFDMQGMSVRALAISLRVLVFVNFCGGQRRPGDVPSWIESQTWLEGVVLFALTVDVCLDAEAGNLMLPENIAKWKAWIKAGLILGGGCRPPSESWSVARYGKGGAPPLREAEAMYGKLALTKRQARQVEVGNALLAFALDVAWLFAHMGGCFYVEHPQYPCWMPMPVHSVWRMAPVRALKRLACAAVVSFDQCTVGAPTKRPTTLLLIRMSIVRQALLRQGDQGRCSHRPSAHARLEGHTIEGGFRTALAKEYPPEMCRIIAEGFVAHARTVVKFGAQTANELPAEWQVWAPELGGVRAQGIQPDFAQ